MYRAYESFDAASWIKQACWVHRRQLVSCASSEAQAKACETAGGEKKAFVCLLNAFKKKSTFTSKQIDKYEYQLYSKAVIKSSGTQHIPLIFTAVFMRRAANWRREMKRTMRKTKKKCKNKKAIKKEDNDQGKARQHTETEEGRTRRCRFWKVGRVPVSEGGGVGCRETAEVGWLIGCSDLRCPLSALCFTPHGFYLLCLPHT